MGGQGIVCWLVSSRRSFASRQYVYLIQLSFYSPNPEVIDENGSIRPLSASSKEEAGTADHTQFDQRDDKDERNDTNTNEKDENKRDHDDEKAEHDDEHNEQGDIPGFDRDEFEIDSEVIQLKKLAYRNHKLDIRVMVTTTDQDVLAEELRALAPGFERAIRDADVDAEKFFAEVHQIKFTLYDEHKNTVFAIFLDLEWLRALLTDEMTDEEFANRICEYPNENEGDDGPPEPSGTK